MRRLFVVGIATDYVVKNTVLAALAERGRQLPALEDVVVLQSGIRGELKPRERERERERVRRLRVLKLSARSQGTKARTSIASSIT